MDKAIFEALVFNGIFEVNNLVRQKEGLSPLSFDKEDHRYSFLNHPELRRSVKAHIDRLYKDLKPFLDS